MEVVLFKLDLSTCSLDQEYQPMSVHSVSPNEKQKKGKGEEKGALKVQGKERGTGLEVVDNNRRHAKVQNGASGLN